MNDAEKSGADEQDPRVLSPAKASKRPSDAAENTASRNTEPPPLTSSPRPSRPAPRERALAPPQKSAPRPDRPSVLQLSLGAARMVLPMVQKMLPLLEGNVATAVSNVLAPSGPGKPVDLGPLENAVGKLHAEQVQLRNSLGEQNVLLKRVSDQIDLVKEATDRHALGQEELLQDLHSLRKKVGVFGWVGLLLLIVSILLNVAFWLRIQHIGP
jgi:hypothetical protein